MIVNKEQIREIAADALEIEPKQIGDRDHFVQDLAMNSLKMLDCVAEIEDQMDVRIRKTDIRSLTCVEQIVDYLEAL